MIRTGANSQRTTAFFHISLVLCQLLFMLYINTPAKVSAFSLHLSCQLSGSQFWQLDRQHSAFTCLLCCLEVISDRQIDRVQLRSLSSACFQAIYKHLHKDFSWYLCHQLILKPFINTPAKVSPDIFVASLFSNHLQTPLQRFHLISLPPACFPAIYKHLRKDFHKNPCEGVPAAGRMGPQTRLWMSDVFFRS